MREPGSRKASESYYPLRQAARVEKLPAAHAPARQGDVARSFTFNWHSAYFYADHAAPLLPKGTVMKITAWHDNTVANKANPDPNVWVGYGDRTVDEMGHAWVNVTYLTDEEYVEEVDARRTRLAAGTR